jgi:mediator of RNA polymerase II transcription subunit 14
MKHYIIDEANARLAFYSPLPPGQLPVIAVPPRPHLPEGVVDTPLIRLYNFLRMVLPWMTLLLFDLHSQR